MQEIKTLFQQIMDGGATALNSLISAGIRESHSLEYKTAKEKFSDRDNTEINKDVSAMANSDGGVIIYGVATDPIDKTKPVRLEPIDVRNIESIDRVISSGIKPDIKGISKHIVEDGEAKYMVLYIPKSEHAPHQSLGSFKYYRRIGTESKAMEHFVLEMYFGKRLAPVLDLIIEITGEDRTIVMNEDGWSNEITLRLFINNSGRKVAKYIQMLILFPSKELLKITSDKLLSNIDELYPLVQARQYTNDQGVIHPETKLRISDLKIKLHNNLLDRPGHNIVDWKISADEMQRKSGSIKVSNLTDKFIVQKKHKLST